MTKKYVVHLLPEERETLNSVIRERKSAGWKVQRSHALLMAMQAQAVQHGQIPRLPRLSAAPHAAWSRGGSAPSKKGRCRCSNVSPKIRRESRRNCRAIIKLDSPSWHVLRLRQAARVGH